MESKEERRETLFLLIRAELEDALNSETPFDSILKRISKDVEKYGVESTMEVISEFSPEEVSEIAEKSSSLLKKLEKSKQKLAEIFHESRKAEK